jgi:flagellar secretion chaperone FliS
MQPSAYDRYLEAEILSADPVNLVVILYRAAIEAVAGARRQLLARDIQQRSRSITRASEIINQLMLTLDHSTGGELSRNLVELYAYMQTRLIDANTNQIDPPLAEVGRLLTTLADAWRMATAPPVESSDDTSYVPVSCVL